MVRTGKCSYVLSCDRMAAPHNSLLFTCGHAADRQVEQRVMPHSSTQMRLLFVKITLVLGFCLAMGGLIARCSG